MAGWALVGVGIGLKGIPTIRAFPTGHFGTSFVSGFWLLAPGFEFLIAQLASGFLLLVSGS
jgi:hypothetical protein